MEVRNHLRKRRLHRLERGLVLALALLALALAAFGGSGAPDVAEIPYTLTRLSSRVIVLDCLDVHVTAIAARSGIVVIDTNRSPGVMRRLRRVIEEEFGRKDFVNVINTHGDPDHSSGNQAFPSIPLIAHQDYRAFVLHDKASTLRGRWSRRPRSESARTGEGAVSQESSAVMLPAITFKDSLNLDLGDLTLELRFCGETHTNHDIVVYVPEERLLLAGDLICSPQSPCFPIDALADTPRLVRELEGLLRRKAGLETVVPGHGKIYTRADLATFCRSVSERYREVRIEDSAARIVSQAIEKEGIQSALKRCPLPAPDSQGTVYWSEEEFGRLGLRLMRRGMVDEAVSVLRFAAGALPKSAYLHNCLGDACLETGDQAAAAVAYRESLVLMPGNRYAAEMLEAIGD